ncbi:MAG: hypothetical protein ACI8QS_001160 [Planctomycetota bacterium]|jgi:hypothetical protein
MEQVFRQTYAPVNPWEEHARLNQGRTGTGGKRDGNATIDPAVPVRAQRIFRRTFRSSWPARTVTVFFAKQDPSMVLASML